MDLDENLPIMNISNETLVLPSRLTSASNRQIRQVILHCKEYPHIEHAQLLSDDTIQHNSNNETTYSGSILFICRFGFISDSNGSEPFRISCQKGVFHPKVTCIGKIFF